MDSACNKRFAIIQWSDGGTGLINLESVKKPRKDVEDYKKGEYISAVYDKTLWRARISDIHHDRKFLDKQCVDGKFPVHYIYDEAEAQRSLGDTPKRKAKETASDSPKRKKRSVQIDMEGNKVMPLNASGAPSTVVSGDVPSTDKTATTITPSIEATTAATTVTPLIEAVTTAPTVAPSTVASGNVLSIATTKETTVMPTTVASQNVLSITKTGPATVTPSTVSSGASTSVLRMMSSTKSGSRSKLEKKVTRLELEVLSLKASLGAVEKRIAELEAGKGECSNSNTAAPAVDSSQAQVDKVLAIVNHIQPTSKKEITEIVKRIALHLFSREDLVRCSRTGKATNKSPSGVTRPALDEAKYKLLERVVLTKCPTLTRQTMINKFDNIVKMERRASKKQCVSDI